MKRLGLVLLLAACASSPNKVGKIRFTNAEPVTLVNDRKPIEAPKSFEKGLVEYYIKEDFTEPVDDALTIEEPTPAANANSLGDVPDSAWFTNRRPTPAEIRRGPGAEGPDRSEPWRVVGVKVGGAAIGITIEDSRKDKYVLKFDERGHPETESSADVIVQRLTWAFGYNVPENNVVTFQRADLVLDEKAEVKYRTGKKRPMTQTDLEGYLALAENDHGKYRALVSKLIGGKVVGGVEPHGTRDGDPNDRVPHELRRDLRGQRVLWAWVNHIDIKSQNALATYTDEKYVKWYALDFGESLGVGTRTTGVKRLGYRSSYSFGDFFASLFTFGLRVEPWERNVTYPNLRGLGHFESEQFDPAKWVPSHNWTPIAAADKHDEFWAAEILMRFTRAHIEAAVAAGSYTDQRTTDYVVKTLLERQRKLGHYAFSRVAPLTQVDARDKGNLIEVCFDDLWLRYRYGAPAATSYRTRAFDYEGKRLADGAWQGARDVRSCMTAPAASTHDGYTIVELDVRRGDDGLPSMYVHVARGKSGPRVIGIVRR